MSEDCTPVPNIPLLKPTMKTLQYLVIAAALTASAFAAPQAILVNAQLVELATNGAELPKDLSRLAERKGVDVLASPQLKTRPGQPTTVSATREVPIPPKGKFPVGVVLTVRPAWAGEGRVRYSVDFDVTRLEGYFAPSTSRAPIFSTTRAMGIEGTAEIGKPVVLVLSNVPDEQMVAEPGKPSRPALIHRRLIAILSFAGAGQ